MGHYLFPEVGILLDAALYRRGVPRLVEGQVVNDAVCDDVEVAAGQVNHIPHHVVPPWCAALQHGPAVEAVLAHHSRPVSIASKALGSIPVAIIPIFMIMDEGLGLRIRVWDLGFGIWGLGFIMVT